MDVRKDIINKEYYYNIVVGDKAFTLDTVICLLFRLDLFLEL